MNKSLRRTAESHATYSANGSDGSSTTTIRNLRCDEIESEIADNFSDVSALETGNQKIREQINLAVGFYFI